MITSPPKNFLLKQKLLAILRWAGLFSVIAVNAFIFLTDHDFIKSPTFQAINAFVRHATDEHKINATLNTISISFHPLPVHLMDSAPVVPVSAPSIAGILWIIAFGMIISFMCFCFFRGEEDINNQFTPSIIIPPPES